MFRHSSQPLRALRSLPRRLTAYSFTSLVLTLYTWWYHENEVHLPATSIAYTCLGGILVPLLARIPLTSSSLLLALSLANDMWGDPAVPMELAPLIAVFDLVSRRYWKQAALFVTIELGEILLTGGIGEALSNLLIFGSSALIGVGYTAARSKAEHAQQETDRLAEQLTSERHQLESDLRNYLHDSVTTNIVSALMLLRQDPHGDATPDPSRTRLVDDLLQEALTDVRELIDELDSYPGALSQTRHARDALPNLTEIHARLTTLCASARLRLTWSIDDAVLVRSTSARVTAFLAIALREATMNAIKYAPKHSEITVRCAEYAGFVNLEISSPVADPSDAPLRTANGYSGGAGLMSLRTRAARLGGRVTAGEAGGQWLVAISVPAQIGVE